MQCDKAEEAGRLQDKYNSHMNRVGGFGKVLMEVDMSYFS
jgi:hypothetical protein